jgi:polysaccharide pyruvyl transferase WcaK-like protein
MAYAFPWTTSQARQPRARDEPASYVVSFRPLAEKQEQATAEAITQTLARMHERGFSGRFLVMAHGSGSKFESDKKVYDKYFRKDGLALIDPFEPGTRLDRSLDTVVATMRNSDVVIATRLHAAILAVTTATPTVAVAYEHKVQQAFCDLGLGEFVHRLNDGSESLLAQVEKALDNKDTFVDAQARLLECGRLGSDFVRDIYRSIGR